MRHVGRHEHGTDIAPEVTEPRCSGNHVWRVRDITFAMPGTYVTEVCERCGALDLAGPDEFTDQRVRSWNPDRPWRRSAIHLEDLARRLAQGAGQPPSMTE